MNLSLHPFKVMRLFTGLWLVLIPSLWLYWDQWTAKPALLAFVAGLPLAAAALASLIRDRWRLELTADALIHHTLGRTERFEWKRMGSLTVRRGPAVLLFAPSFWFEFPLDEPRTLSERASKLIGRRLLCVFGDHSPAETVKIIEDWRALYSKKVQL